MMVELIGIGFMVALVWLVTYGMAATGTEKHRAGGNHTAKTHHTAKTKHAA